MTESLKDKKLLLIGPSVNSVHLRTYYHLIKDHFGEILIVTESEIDFADFKTIDFSIKNPFKALKNIKILRAIIQQFNPDIIHAHQANSCSYMAVKANKNKFPLVVTAWGSDVLVLPERSRLLKKMVTIALKNANVVTADAQYMIDVIQELNPGTKTILANFGIELHLEQNPEKEEIIYSNRLHKDLYKVKEIIDAFKTFNVSNENWKLIVGAKGPDTEKLKLHAENDLKANSFEFIGFVDQDENRRQYLRAQIWVSVPVSDGTAISLLEAMGYGCVPVVSDLPANREWIEDGVNGVIVKDSLVESLEKAKDMDQQKVASMNSELIMKKGTKDVNRALFLEIYNSIIG